MAFSNAWKVLVGAALPHVARGEDNGKGRQVRLVAFKETDSELDANETLGILAKAYDSAIERIKEQRAGFHRLAESALT